MGRRGSKELIENLITKLRTDISDVVIRTSLIVGFPGEDQHDFEQLYKFLEQYKLDRVGVFTYSKEENTPAARMKLQVTQKIKKSRYKVLMEQQKEISLGKNNARIGKIYKALIEGISDDGIFYKGRTYAEAPDIDGNVYFTSKTPVEEGCFVNIKILDADEYDITGEVK
jgi:ribosomal protein S12 methylthiotransferase